MRKNLLKAFTDYFTHLENYGYLDYNNVFALLVFDFIDDLLSNDFRGMLHNEDINELKEAMKTLSRCSCLIPPNANNFYIGDTTELATRIKRLEILLHKAAKTIKNNEAKIDAMYPFEEKDLTNGPWKPIPPHPHHHPPHHHHEHHHGHHCHHGFFHPHFKYGKTPIEWGEESDYSEEEEN